MYIMPDKGKKVNERDNRKSSETKSSNDAARSLLVVNMRGLVNTRTPVRTTLEQLGLLKRFNATIIPDNEISRGMLVSAKEHLSWCELDSPTAEKLLSKRAEISDGKRLDESTLKKSGFSSFAELASALTSGKITLKEEMGFRRFFRLSPPKGGFKRSTRRQFGQGGILGSNKELPQLVERMI
jgi:large subunit ribosomal protein L30